MKLAVFPSSIETSRALILRLVELMNEEPDRIFNIAVSGGNTPALMFDLWANEYLDITPWNRMKIYWVDERCAGRGYAPMAVALLADWAMFDPTGPRLHRMEIDILPENKRSRAVARKVGATLEGVRRAYMYVNGQWRDHESYVLMAEDAPNGFTARLMTGNSPS